MAKYKVLLAVQDNYGHTKEFDGGTIDINLAEEDVENIVDNLKEDIIAEARLPVYVPDVTQDNMLKFTLTEEATKEELEFDIEKSNDWNKIDNTTSSSYVWEPMK